MYCNATLGTKLDRFLSQLFSLLTHIILNALTWYILLGIGPSLRQAKLIRVF